MVIVTKPGQHRRRQRGLLIADLIIALTLLFVGILPLAFSFASEQKLLRAYYHRALAVEIVDGEFEILAAGEWRAFPVGNHVYSVHADSRTNLPPGRFVLTLSTNHLRLEWLPVETNRGRGGPVVREGMLP